MIETFQNEEQNRVQSPCEDLIFASVAQPNPRVHCYKHEQEWGKNSPGTLQMKLKTSIVKQILINLILTTTFFAF